MTLYYGQQRPDRIGIDLSFFFKAHKFTQELQTFLAAREHQFGNMKQHTLYLVVCDHKLGEAVSMEKAYTSDY